MFKLAAQSIIFDISSNWFRTIFERKVTDAKMVENEGGEKVTEKVTENQKKIILLMRKNMHVTVVEIAENINISRKSVLENIFKLKQKGLLKRIGPDKGGHWEVKEII